MVLLDQIGPNLDNIHLERKKKPNRLFGLVKDIVLVGFFSLCVFVFINYPAIALIGTYKLAPKQLAFTLPANEELKQVVTEEKPIIEAPQITQYPDNTLFIPKIGVKATIGWDIKGAEVMDQLEKSVVHLADTDKPGGPGNVFITGHSSNYWWKSGDYNTVFALVPQLNEGDEIVITYKGEFHYYKITDKQEMRKDEVSDHLESGRPRLTLMTCVPVGTNLKRLLVFAEPVNK